jgi:hypothetical protein
LTLRLRALHKLLKLSFVGGHSILTEFKKVFLTAVALLLVDAPSLDPN